MKKFAKTASNIVYIIGTACVLALGAVAVFAPDELPNPDAMVPLGFSAFICLIVGMVPMNLACFAVYMLNGLHSGKRRIINFILIFLPGFVCVGCFLFLMLGSFIYNLFG